jgi:hypothetical protein
MPWITPVLLLALAVAFAAVFARVQAMVFGDSNLPPQSHAPALFPVFAHLGLSLLLGLFVPPFLVQWYRQAALLIGG